MTPRCFAKSRRAPGFTLVELLVAFAISMLLLVALAGVISQTMSTSRKARNSLEAYNSAAAAMDLLANDLESLAARGQPFEFLQTVKEDVAGAADVTRLFMVSLSTQDNLASAGAGQMHAICYRLLRQDPVSAGGSNPVYGIYRTSVDAPATFAQFAGAADLSGPFGSVAVTLDDFVAGNIVDFQIRFYESGDVAAANDVNGSTGPVRLAGRSAKVNGAAWSGGELGWAEVMLTVLEDQGIKALESGSLSMADARSRYGHTLTRRVALRSPLAASL